MPQWLSHSFQSWHDGKLFVERLTSVSHDALHIVAGTCAWLALAIILRRPLTAWLPIVGVLVLAVINEVVDLWVEIWPEPALQAGEAGKDVLATLFVPVLLVLAFRLVPALTTIPRKRSR